MEPPGDLAGGRRTEIAVLNGWVAARAAALGVDAPANAELAERVRRREKGLL